MIDLTRTVLHSAVVVGVLVVGEEMGRFGQSTQLFKIHLLHARND
jgi:hypothetical protein